ncbi:hypothetical protein PILCRDRAFT_305332 [Piloderma croceum F 1598]|uniref:Uncharacterized protein n=1 Tax=Piloderma croceum (strain F 1598) TaxID=765440 RepID=A0A0C3CC39_PILCF|nr:hypothetical protein PILCRDRAFT_305332 [Piloderma croceum F 1598]
MSNTPEAVKPEFDFWEFVSCARCHLAFSSDLGVPQIPFWLTECGHIPCHFPDADQSCAQCGERGIQLVPLQQNVCLKYYLLCLS